MKKKNISAIILVFSLLSAIANSAIKKLDWFEDAKFGMFIHWGVYSKIAGEWNGREGYNEHVMFYAKIPIVEYEKVAKTLNPVDFNAEAWGDGILIYQSKIMRAEDAAEKVDIDIKGINELKLIVNDGGDGQGWDHADWAEAKLL